MICVTGAERTTSALAARLAAYATFSRQEVRLDLLDRLDDEVFALLRSPRIIATCRSAQEGGGFTGTDAALGEVLRRVLEERPGFLDVEARLPREFRQELHARRGKTRMILSWHGPHASQVPDLGGEDADLLKVAVPVSDPAELAGVLDLLPEERRPVIRIGTGEAGLLSRALYRRFGAPWTYAVADGTERSAPGQLTVSQATEWRLAEAADFIPLGLVGGESVARSPGPRVYNRLFSKLGLPHLYLPVASARPVEVLALLERLGFGGCSVTMPAKEILANHVDTLEPPADRVRAVNTVLFRAGRRVAYNTDVGAVADLVGELPGAAALVLGAGGAARAAVVALLQQGCAVSVCARRAESADALAAALGVRSVPWELRAQVEFRVLVNATPVGGDGQDSPLPEQPDWTGRVVVDAVIADRLTPLMQQVVRGGGRAIPGTAWWLAQGARQMELLVGTPLAQQVAEEPRG